VVGRIVVGCGGGGRGGGGWGGGGGGGGGVGWGGGGGGGDYVCVLYCYMTRYVEKRCVSVCLHMCQY